MTLRGRLTLVLGVLVLVPLLGGAVLVGIVVPRTTQARAETSLDAAASGITSTVVATCERSGAAVRALARDLGSRTPAEAARGVVADGLTPWAAVVDTSGEVVGRAGDVPGGGDPSGLGGCSHGRAVGSVVADSARVQVAGSAQRLTVVAGTTVTSALLGRWAAGIGFDGSVHLGNDGQVVAGTGGGDITGQATTTRRPAPGQPFTVVVAVEAPSAALVRQVVALVVLGALVLSVLVGRWLADDMVRPVEEATRVAEQVAAGDLTRTIDVRRGDEIGRLAVAFNHMTGELRGYVHALESSHDAMRANLERLGEALSATHDLDGLLPVVLESALSSVGAGAGVVLLVEDDGRVTVQAEQGMGGPGLPVPGEVRTGVGVLGGVAAGYTARGRLGEDGLIAAPGEPAEGQVLAVPLLRASEVVGVIAMYQPENSEWFTDADEEALYSLARQAAIAVENVILHNEAQLASLTDPLTGLWNVRYLTLAVNREIERSARFSRTLSLLMLDLDHFKRVNDTFGHARGDAVLAEFAARVRSQVREVDTVARYGGEEFVVVLPETSIDGAMRLAERIATAVRGTPFDAGDRPGLQVTVSIGAAVFPDNGSTGADLVDAADAALYEAKHTGRDRCVAAVAVPHQL